jgi:hypothetical protein
MTTSEATFSLSVPPPPSPPYGFLLDGFVVEEMSQYPLARRHEPSDLEGGHLGGGVGAPDGGGRDGGGVHGPASLMLKGSP